MYKLGIDFALVCRQAPPIKRGNINRPKTGFVFYDVRSHVPKICFQWKKMFGEYDHKHPKCYFPRLFRVMEGGRNRDKGRRGGDQA